MSSPAFLHRRETRQRERLATLVDAVFAVVLVVLVIERPFPEGSSAGGGSIWAFLSIHKQALVAALIGACLVVLYWVQSNALFGNLGRTDNRHTILALCQIFFLLLYLYSIALGMAFPGDAAALALQSTLACLVGLASAGSWRYACRNRRLLSDQIHAGEAWNLQLNFLTEPITALLTVPFAFVGETSWGLTWPSYPLVARALRRWRRVTAA